MGAALMEVRLGRKVVREVASMHTRQLSKAVIRDPHMERRTVQIAVPHSKCSKRSRGLSVEGCHSHSPSRTGRPDCPARRYAELSDTFRTLSFDTEGLAETAFARHRLIVAPDPLRAAEQSANRCASIAEL